MVNKVIIMGNLGRDPEGSFSQNGNPIVALNVATTEKRKDKQTGETIENTEWHRIKFFGKQAEIIVQYFKKGSPIYIEGRIHYYDYEKDGVKMYGTEIIGQNFSFVPGGNSQATGNQSFGHPQQQQGFQQQQQPFQQPETFGQNIKPPFNPQR